jgi:hypothetical protein
LVRYGVWPPSQWILPLTLVKSFFDSSQTFTNGRVDRQTDRQADTQGCSLRWQLATIARPDRCRRHTTLHASNGDLASPQWRSTGLPCCSCLLRQHNVVRKLRSSLTNIFIFWWPRLVAHISSRVRLHTHRTLDCNAYLVDEHVRVALASVLHEGVRLLNRTRVHGLKGELRFCSHNSTW